ncbi:MAG: tryptophan--tRNA ligase [Phycisphaerales bacterium]|nr:tryptophan--tRNA ligase [Phycisphaerales bacterium]
MKRVLSGIQPSGQLHLGNYAGAIRQFIAMQDTHEMFIFVASYHALTSVQNPAQLRSNIRQIVIDYLAFGLDPAKCHIYLQQDVPQVTELAWLLSCVCPKSMMDKATSFKDKTAKGLSASMGLFTYPVLQAADILAVDADFVPVGEDQRQHLEITRDLAERFNHAYGPVFKLPDIVVRKEAGVLPGVDGQKMSKSYGNTIDPFLPEKVLRKLVMSIKTDSQPVEAVKDPQTCTVFQIYRGLAGESDPRTNELAMKYTAGGMGYGIAKQALFELIMDHFGPARARRDKLQTDPGMVDQVLRHGAAGANQIINNVTTRARLACGL